MDFDFLKPAKYSFIISIILTVASIVLVFYPGPRMSIEFTGGTRMEISIAKKATTAQEVTDALSRFHGETLNAIVNKLQNGNFLVRMKGIGDETHKALLAYLKTPLGPLEQVQYTTIGPTVGETLKVRAAYAILAASFGIIVYLAFAFRKIPRKYSPWKFGTVAVAALLHDVMVTAGIFTIMSYYTSFEVDTLFVTALLTILGYSVNDTIIIFDRIRDNLFVQERKESFASVTNRSINQVWMRSVFTSSATLIMLFSLLLLGSASTHWFVLTLIIGILLGTYSSIFIAAPFLVIWNDRKKIQ
ncbi:MAG: protein translocase subunit SecF [Candidatus Peribacteraceae bacterium]